MFARAFSVRSSARAASQSRFSFVRMLLASAALLAGGALLVASPAAAQGPSGGVLQGTMMHLSDYPSTWGRDTGGYLARVGSGVAYQLTQSGVHHGLAAALDLRLESPDPEGPVGARVGQAMLQELTTRTTSGRRVPAVAETAGTYAATLAQSRLHHGQWRPGDAAINAVIATGLEAVWAAGSELVEAL